MKSKTIFVLVLAFLLISGFFVYDGLSFENKALARGRDNANSMDVEKQYYDLLSNQIKKVVYEEKNAALITKRNALLSKQDHDLLSNIEGKKITYDIEVDMKEDFKEVFSKSLFIGDSITHGLLYYKEINAANVMADIGQGLKKTVNNISKISAKKPDNIYIMLGLNDSISNITPEKYKEEYSNLLDKINEILPDTKVYITSILPVDKRNKTATGRIDNEKLNKMNEQLMELSSEKGISFIDIRPFLEKHPDFYEPDGIHVKRIFQKYWLKFIQINYL